MSNGQVKRQNDGKAIAPRKKRKLDAKARNKEVASSSAFVQSEALKWRGVQLPDRLEDAEGFFGLEEIEDVEVVKDTDGKHVFFRPKSEDQVQHVATDETAGGSDSEWEGFGDTDVIRGSSSTTVKTDPAEEPFQTKTASKVVIGPPQSKRKDAQTLTDIELQPKVGFEALTEGSEDQQSSQNTDTSAWESLQLSRPLLAAIAHIGFGKPTPIQSSAIGPIIEGHDVIGKAVTGSGKTLAFGIPIFEHWLEKRLQSKVVKGLPVTPLALILAPTRELAHQLSKHLNDLGKGLIEQPRIVTVTGGLSILKQQRLLNGADIIIGTPGRLWEVISESQGLIDRLKNVHFLIVDEADRLLSEGHFKEVEEILDTLDREVLEEDEKANKAARPPRQTLVFSATFHRGLQQKLTGKVKQSGGDLLSNKQSMEYLLKKLAFREEKPLFIDANPTSQMASALRESILECGAMEKDVHLYALAIQNAHAKILVFANSISSVRRLTPLLQNLGMPAVALHSTMPQKARLRSLEKFSAQSTILVATDVAARGLDIKGIDLIVHYHVPRTADMYVHRSGRTARADKAGMSVLLCSPDEVAGVTRLIGKIHNEKAPGVVQIDRQIISRLAPRVALSKKLTDTIITKEKSGSQDEWLRSAAEELGADYDSEAFAAEGARNSRGRGAGKTKKQKEAGVVSKAEMVSMKTRLKEMLSKRVNMGTSERYLAGGKVDVDALLEGGGDTHFLGMEGGVRA